MSIQFSHVRTAIAALVLAAAPAAAAVPPAQAHGNPDGNQGRHPQRVCAATGHADVATCHAEVMVNAKGMVPASSTPPGMSPTDLLAAYNLPENGAPGNVDRPTVAIVDAYGYPRLASDLAMYRQTFGLPACITDDGCLRVVDQRGGSALPRMDTGWAGEQALDVDAVSAICPKCHILVVQASSSSMANLGAAVKWAATQSDVVAISNSYGGGDLSDNTYGDYYNHPGIAITASTGDNGYQGGSYPASSSYVTAVGGTSLTMTGTTRKSETAWSGAGSGCSTLNAAVAPSTTTGCDHRAMADVAAAADPRNGGMAVYYPTSSKRSTWAQVGGTSEASPIIAAVYALAGDVPIGAEANLLPYLRASDQTLNDITSGSNGTCPTLQWCNAADGQQWDGPTGLGTPNGIGAF